jgi:deoxyribodipyrimidine photo-lyase
LPPGGHAPARRHAGGRRRLRQFLEAGRHPRYKETRNCLDPLDGSSTLSPWLANGNLSAREVARAIAEHEARTGANESTYWLYFELLWREFFYWRALEDGGALFRAGGREGGVIAAPSNRATSRAGAPAIPTSPGQRAACASWSPPAG